MLVAFFCSQEDISRRLFRFMDAKSLACLNQINVTMCLWGRISLDVHYEVWLNHLTETGAEILIEQEQEDAYMQYLRDRAFEAWSDVLETMDYSSDDGN